MKIEFKVRVEIESQEKPAYIKDRVEAYEERIKRCRSALEDTTGSWTEKKL